MKCGKSEIKLNNNRKFIFMGTIEIREKLHEYIDNSTDDIVAAVFAFFKTYNRIPKDEDLDIAEYNKELEEAMAEIDNDEFYTQSEVESIIMKRYEKPNLVEEGYKKF